MLRIGLVLGVVLTAALPWGAAAGATAQPAIVVIGDSFQPATVEVEVGATVTWRNDDDERHRVRTDDGAERLDSGNLEPGEQWSHTFTAPGRHAYVDWRNRDDPAYRGVVVVAGGAGGAGAEGQAPETGAAPPPDAGTSTQVSIVDRSFAPAQITVPAGTTVTWANTSDDEHTVTADDGAFDSGELTSGASFSQRFDTPGTFGYFCALHGGMRGTVVVEGGAESAPSAATEAPSDPAPTPQPRASSSPSVAAAPSEPTGDGAATVDVVDFSFTPAALVVAPGTEVEWRSTGEVPHTVTSAGQGPLDSGLIQPGDSFRHTFEEPGTFDYVCELHPQMTATVTVAEDAGAAQSSAPGASPSSASARAPALVPASASSRATASNEPAGEPSAARVVSALVVLGLLAAAAALVAARRLRRARRRPLQQGSGRG